MTNTTVLVMTAEEADLLSVKYLTKDAYVVNPSVRGNMVIINRLDGTEMPALAKELINLRNATKSVRCWNCEHLSSFHQEDGCWFTLTEGVVDQLLNCMCSLSKESSSSREVG